MQTATQEWSPARNLMRVHNWRSSSPRFSQSKCMADLSRCTMRLWLKWKWPQDLTVQKIVQNYPMKGKIYWGRATFLQTSKSVSQPKAWCLNIFKRHLTLLGNKQRLAVIIALPFSPAQFELDQPTCHISGSQWKGLDSTTVIPQVTNPPYSCWRSPWNTIHPNCWLEFPFLLVKSP